MAKGGARARSGPPPQFDALRRDRDRRDWIVLPAEGRDGPTPEWPLTGALAHLVLPSFFHRIEDEDTKARVLAEAEATASAAFARELELWEREWRRPQAVAWEANGQEIEVALYVRALAAAEDPGAKVTLRTLVKQQQEALGISLPGLARNRWMIGSTKPEAPSPSAAVSRARSSARNRFRVVDGGAGAA